MPERPTVDPDDLKAPASPQLPLLYEDDQLIAVAKPAGMFVHRSEADRSATEFVVQTVRDELGAFVYPVHRLDRATSGIVLLAKTSEAAALMGPLFANRLVSKTYQALVRGHCADEGVLDTPLIPSKGRGKPEGHPFREPQEAITHFLTLNQYEIPLMSDRYPTTRCSLLQVQPVTGRYHQIRRHLNYCSHPVIGDTSHGDTRQNRFYASHFGLTRLMLAAVQMQFQHPVDDRTVRIECPPNASFRTVVQQLDPYQC